MQWRSSQETIKMSEVDAKQKQDKVVTQQSVVQNIARATDSMRALAAAMRTLSIASRPLHMIQEEP